MSWVLTKSAYNDEEFRELINLETGITIREDYNEDKTIFAIWQSKIGLKNKYSFRVYHSDNLESVQKVFDKICRKLNVQNEIGPDTNF